MSKFYVSVSSVLLVLMLIFTNVDGINAKTEQSHEHGFFTNQMKLLQNVLVQSFPQELISNSNFESTAALPSPMAAMMTECVGGPGNLGGTAFGDFNYDGIEDSGTVGIPNVDVHLFAPTGVDGASVLVSSTTTDELGHYTFSGLTDGDQYRVEFHLPTYLSSLKQYTEGGSDGVNNTTGTQMAMVPSCDVDAGFAFAEDFYGDNPFMAATCFVNGNPDPVVPPADDAENPSFEKTVVWFRWDYTGSTVEPLELANAGQTGSVYGMAFNRFTQKLYTSAFIKRHTGLGPLGLGGIYEVDVTDIDVPVFSPLVDVATIGINVGSIDDNVTRGLPDLVNDPSNDAIAYDKVGKEGIGAIAVDEIANALYFVNLFDKNVYRIDLDSDNDPATAPTAADVTSFTLPADPCNNGEFRPFSVNVHRGQVYVGGNCDGTAGGTAADLTAYVYRLDGTTFTQVATADLDYTKGYAANENNCDNFPGWYPWESTIPTTCSGTGTETVVYPTPLLSDFQFDADGSLVLGFMDRTGHQIGYRNYPLAGETPLLSVVSGGDILRLYNNAGTYEQEVNGTAGPFTSGGAGNAQGPGGGEFYFMDLFAGPSDNIPFPPHIETAQGDLAIFPGSNQIATTSLDPYSTLFNSGGVNWMDGETGEVRPEGYVLYRSSTSDISTFSKGNGLGGLITLGESAPSEVGGVIWNDANSDGIQDGNEAVMPNVNVSLYDATGVQISTTMSNANGTYSFGGADLALNTDYYLVFGEGGQFDITDGSLNGNTYITVANTGMFTDPDRNDSDIIMTPSGVAGDAFTTYPSIFFTTGSEGWVSHDMDAGFTADNLNPIAGVGGTIFYDNDDDGIQDGAVNDEGGIEGVTINLFDSSDVLIGTTTTDINGDYYFINIPTGTYYVNVDPTTNTTGLMYEFSTMDTGGDDALDSDINATTMNSDPFVFDPANGDADIDGGLAAPVGSIGGFVFNDLDMNGIQGGAMETAISNVTVLLYIDGNTIPEQTVVTDASGIYTFTNVPLGDYFIDFDATTNDLDLAGLSGSPMDAGSDDTIDSDADANAGETNVFTFDPAVTPTADFDAGFFQPTGTITGTTFLDNNEDGIQDVDDTMFEGITVTLIDSDGDVYATTTTDSNGDYVFTGVIADDYTVVFDETTNIDGLDELSPTLQDQGGDDTVDSDISTGGTVTITGFDPMMSVVVDGGFVQAMTSVSGFVFTDVNEDGIQQGTEPTINGVTVTLFDDNDVVIGTTTTTGDGAYIFTGIPSGNYYVTFDPTTAGITDFEYSTQDQGADDNVDSDVNISGSTATFTVDALTPTPVTNVNAGVIFAGGNIMGFAWKDCNDGIFAAGEASLQGVPVSLAGQDMAGNAIAQSTTTDITGAYSFMSLPQGDYTLTFGIPALPTGLGYAAANQGGDELLDSDADVITGSTAQFALASGETIEDYSVAFRDTAAPAFVNPPADEDVSCGDPDFGTPPTLTATDNCDTDVAITFTETMDTATGDCSGITIVRTWVATDDCGNSSTHTQTLNATDNTAPVITIVNPDLLGFMDGDTIFFSCNDDIPVYGADDVEATDVCDADPEVTFEDFLITIGDCTEGGFLQEMYCGWIATDNCGNADTLNIYLVVSDNEAPVLVGMVPADITITCADTIPDAPILTATDNCVEDIMVEFDESVIGDTCDVVKITRKYTATDDCGNMTMQQYNIYIETPELEIFGVPADVTLDCADLMDPPMVTYSHECHGFDTLFEEVIIGDICEDYKIIRKWTAMNDCGQMAMEQYTIDVIVEDVEITGVPADVTVTCDNVPEPATPTVNDECYLVELEYSEIVLNSICETYEIVRTWTATDECGGSTTESQTITVEVEELGLTGVPADITIDCTEEIPPVADPQPSSDCYDVMIDFGETLIGDTCSNYKILRVWVANDFCGNQIMEMQTIVVEVPELELTNLPADLTLECDENVPAPVDPTPTSDCYEVVIEFEESIVPGACATEFTIERNWAATDDCGNVVTHEQLISVIDTTGPVVTVDHPDLVGLPSGSTLTYDCSDLVNLMDAPATAIDNCVDEPLEVNFMEMTELGDCEVDGFIIRMDCCWKAEDPCGNQSEYCVTVIITDTEAPVLTGVPADVTINLAAGDIVPEAADVTATDACADPELSFIETQEALDCGYVLTRTWLAEDDCGNSVFQSQIITVNDICDCPDIVIDDIVIVDSDCNNDNGSITITTELSENIYDFILLPNYGNQNEVGNVVTDLPPGSYLMIVNLPNVDNCDEKIYFDIEESGCSDEVDVALADGQTDYCIDESVFNIEGTITSSSFCDAGNASTVLASNLDDNCLTLTAADGFEGLSPDKICVVNCFNGSTTDCDTTYLNITVTPVIQPCALALSGVETADDLCGFGIGSVSFSVVGGEGPFTFDWTDGISDNVIATGLTAGTYSVTITDNGTDCILNESFTISDAQLPALENSDVSVSDATCNGAADGQISSTTGTTYNVYNSSNTLVGTTPLSGLPAGNYVVTEESGNCTANLSVFITEPAAIVITPIVTQETCNGGDGSIQLTVAGGAGDLTYFWSPNVSANATAADLFAGVFSVTVVDGEGCTGVLENITVDLDCSACDLTYTATSQDILCGGEETGTAEIQTTEDYTYVWSTGATTSSVSDLFPGEFSVTISEVGTTCTAVENFTITSPELMFVFETVTNETCDGDDGTITLDVIGGTLPYNYAWSSDISVTNTATGLAAGTYSVTVGDANACETVFTYEVIEDCDPTGCPTLVVAEIGNAGTTDCTAPIGYCLDVPFSTVIDWDISLNGADYASSLIGCNFDTNFIYNYQLIPDAGENGPYTMTSWMVDGVPQTGTFNNSAELIALMNSLDFFGQWSIDEATQTISGGLLGSTYGNMLVTQDATGATGDLIVSSTFTPLGTQLLINEGLNTLIFTDANGCADTLTVTGNCLTTETVEITIPNQQTGTFCPDTAELPGDDINVEFICGTCDNVGLALAPGGCFQYTGVAEGQDALTVIACDEFGVCDTTLLVITVVETQPVNTIAPMVHDDFYTTQINVPVLLKVTENDLITNSITDFGVQRTPNYGYIDINFDNTIMYSPVEDFCGDDLLTYYLCVGEDCASATANIYVECDAPRPVMGFSPNGDGVNDKFMIEGLEQFENNSLSIYDRRGITMFETTDYKNNWVGKWRGNDLPDGTYFYVLRYEGGKIMSGYVQIMR